MSGARFHISRKHRAGAARNTINSQRAALAISIAPSPPDKPARLTVSPARAEPKAMALSCTVMMEEAAKSCSSEGATTSTPDAKWGKARPTLMPPRIKATQVSPEMPQPPEPDQGISTVRASRETSESNGEERKVTNRVRPCRLEVISEPRVQPTDIREAK